MSGTETPSGTADGHEHDAPDSVPDLILEKLALDELADPAQAQALRARIEAEPDGSLAQRMAALQRSNAEILEEHPPADMAAAVQRRLARLEADERASKARSGGWMMWAPLAAAACVLLLWWTGGGPGPDLDAGGGPIAIADTETPSSAGLQADTEVETGAWETGTQDREPTRLKGDPRLMVDHVANGRPTRMKDDDSVTAGDLLQVAYLAGGARQGVIVSIDGAGITTLHFPASELDAPTLAQGSRVTLPTSYELDAAPGFERFFFVTVDSDDEPEFSVSRVLQAARDLAGSKDAREGALALPSTWRQQSLRLTK